MTSTHVDPSLRQAILLHLFRNLGPTASRHALLLAITGPTGEGKTFQTDETLARLGVDVSRIESGELESELAGQPAERIRLAYLRAGVNEHRISALVINDLDTAVGDWGAQVQYTVNRQAVFGQLMALCDSPTMVNGQGCGRVPVIVTGNDFTRLYAPLTRPGRMRTFSWVPSVEQRLPIMTTMFPWLKGRALHDMAMKYPDQPVAFWSAVASMLDDETTLEAIQKVGEHAALQMAKNGRAPAIDHEAITADQILDAATRLAGASTHQNFLNQRGS